MAAAAAAATDRELAFVPDDDTGTTLKPHTRPKGFVPLLRNRLPASVDHLVHLRRSHHTTSSISGLLPCEAGKAWYPGNDTYQHSQSCSHDDRESLSNVNFPNPFSSTRRDLEGPVTYTCAHFRGGWLEIMEYVSYCC